MQVIIKEMQRRSGKEAFHLAVVDAAKCFAWGLIEVEVIYLTTSFAFVVKADRFDPESKKIQNILALLMAQPQVCLGDHTAEILIFPREQVIGN